MTKQEEIEQIEKQIAELNARKAEMESQCGMLLPMLKELDKGTQYWYCGADGVAYKSYWISHECDKGVLDFGSIHPTEESAEAWAELAKAQQRVRAVGMPEVGEEWGIASWSFMGKCWTIDCKERDHTGLYALGFACADTVEGREAILHLCKCLNRITVVIE